ncbi:MAG: hypothetical protein FWB76_08210 [Oscillospiraceae bacterium]|nr:hypothetical protein [Oscillospiraceae bacterium]
MNGILVACILMFVVGMLLGMEYKGDGYRVLLWICKAGSAGAAAAALALMLLLDDIPHVAIVVVGLAAIGFNLPLATIGLKRK